MQPALAAGFQPTEDRESELVRLRAEIGRLQADLEGTSERRQGLAASLERLAVELRLQEVRVEETATAYGLSELRVLEIGEAVRELERRQDEAREDLRRHLLTLYGFGQQRTLRLLLSVDGAQDLPQAMRQMRYLAQRDSVALARFEALQVELSTERDRLVVERTTLALLFEEESRRQVELRATRMRHRDLLAEVDRHHRRLSARSEDLQEREGRLAKLIELLVDSDSQSRSQTSMAGLRGVLDWPMEGGVVTEFGPRLDRRYKTRIPHNGVAIRAAAGGAAVRAIYGGKVLFAQDFEGFGLTVVLSHGGGILSLYAGLDRIEVRKGDVVDLESLLGRAAGELYFEIREQNEAVDPREWLR